jgi:hypothetical protein
MFDHIQFNMNELMPELDDFYRIGILIGLQNVGSQAKWLVCASSKAHFDVINSHASA